jgi:hypothetical protein
MVDHVRVMAAIDVEAAETTERKLMPESSGMHKSLRQEWAETPPDVSYRFVVSSGTMQAAGTVASAVIKKRRSRWEHALAFLMSLVLYYFVMTLWVLLVSWLSIQAALLFSSTLLRIVAFLVTFLGLIASVRLAVRSLSRLSGQRVYREFYSDNEFLLEGRKSHLWFDERSAGAIRQWSTFEQLVEFEEGMWLFLRRGTTFAGLRGILISKESLPNSCSWSELQGYLQQRIEEGARDEAGV